MANPWCVALVPKMCSIVLKSPRSILQKLACLSCALAMTTISAEGKKNSNGSKHNNFMQRILKQTVAKRHSDEFVTKDVSGR